ncbi:MAG: hypothetical protein KBT60_11375 [Methyloceanibacter sp.]|nr:hypothetical protein [Methyloceanibacter sp.]
MRSTKTQNHGGSAVARDVHLLFFRWRVARTLGDLDGEGKVGRIHIAEALSCRGETLRRDQAAARKAQASLSPGCHIDLELVC